MTSIVLFSYSISHTLLHIGCHYKVVTGSCLYVIVVLTFFIVHASATPDKLDVKLTEQEVAKLLELIHTSSSHKWDMIGLKIGFTFSELENIRSIPMLLLSAPTSYLKELLSRWVRWPSPIHPTKPTLRALCTSLRSSLVGLGSLADKVEREMTQAITGKVWSQ